MAKIEDIIYEMVEPIVEENGLDLVDVAYIKEGSEWFLRIFIDKEEGITLEDCEKISYLVSDKLDENDPITQAYHLEISSPGIERPLKKTKDFLRFINSSVYIKTYIAINSKKTFQGILEDADEEKIIINTDGEKTIIPRDKIAKANLTWD